MKYFLLITLILTSCLNTVELENEEKSDTGDSSDVILNFSSEFNHKSSETILSFKGIQSSETSSSFIKEYSLQNSISSSVPTSSNESPSSSSLDILSSSKESPTYGTLIDTRDNKIYKTITIATQTWMAENLNYGDFIIEDESANQKQIGFQKFCYSNLQENCDTLGGLYQWHTALGCSGIIECSEELKYYNHQGICPSGWHVPKRNEWKLLESVLMEGTYPQDDTGAGLKMKTQSFGGDNSSGFSVIAAGARGAQGGFSPDLTSTAFWEAEESSSYGFTAYSQSLSLNSKYLNQYSLNKEAGFSIRCLQNQIF